MTNRYDFDTSKERTLKLILISNFTHDWRVKTLYRPTGQVTTGNLHSGIILLHTLYMISMDFYEMPISHEINTFIFSLNFFFFFGGNVESVM